MFTISIGIRVVPLIAASLVLAACGSVPSSTAEPPEPTADLAAPTASVPSPAPSPGEPTYTVQAASVPAAQATEVAPTAEPIVAPTSASEATSVAPALVKLNLNTATGEEFLTIPNVGNRMVREFMEYRPYASIQQFRREIGKYVDQAQVAEYEKHVFVPVSPNTADAETLQQLPGVDPRIAEQLIVARPYASRAAFLQKLSEVLTADQLALAESYVGVE
jgi:DNA uptake protein ComE-like DNA-binding protein